MPAAIKHVSMSRVWRVGTGRLFHKDEMLGACRDRREFARRGQLSQPCLRARCFFPIRRNI